MEYAPFTLQDFLTLWSIESSTFVWREYAFLASKVALPGRIGAVVCMRCESWFGCQLQASGIGSGHQQLMQNCSSLLFWLMFCLKSRLSDADSIGYISSGRGAREVGSGLVHSRKGVVGVVIQRENVVAEIAHHMFTKTQWRLELG